ncbi:hypothetical protein THAOC_10576, partial [Thalassiosira oceanica]
GRGVDCHGRSAAVAVAGDRICGRLSYHSLHGAYGWGPPGPSTSTPELPLGSPRLLGSTCSPVVGPDGRVALGPAQRSRR